MNNFHYIAVLLDLIYGIEMKDEDLEEIGLIAWNLIGNKNIKLYRYCTCIDPSDNSVTLPCNAVQGTGASGGVVEAVTAPYEDWSRVTNYSELGDYKTAFVENSIETSKIYPSPFYISGKMLKYEQVGNKLYFAFNYGTVNILYKGILADEEGLPEITDKEANAIATYIAYTQKYKEGLITNNANIINLAKSLKADWLQQCDQARVTYLNQNDMNDIIEIRNSWDRGTYSKTFKGLK